jgi:hypothetical protein
MDLTLRRSVASLETARECSGDVRCLCLESQAQAIAGSVACGGDVRRKEVGDYNPEGPADRAGMASNARGLRRFPPAVRPPPYSRMRVAPFVVSAPHSTRAFRTIRPKPNGSVPGGSFDCYHSAFHQTGTVLKLLRRLSRTRNTPGLTRAAGNTN